MKGIEVQSQQWRMRIKQKLQNTHTHIRTQIDFGYDNTTDMENTLNKTQEEKEEEKSLPTNKKQTTK